jgi:hypothetical protein
MLQFSAPGQYSQSWMAQVISQITAEFGTCLKANQRIMLNGATIGTTCILISPNGTKYQLKVNNDGSLTTTAV